MSNYPPHSLIKITETISVHRPDFVFSGDSRLSSWREDSLTTQGCSELFTHERLTSTESGCIEPLMEPFQADTYQLHSPSPPIPAARFLLELAEEKEEEEEEVEEEKRKLARNCLGKQGKSHVCDHCFQHYSRPTNQNCAFY